MKCVDANKPGFDSLHIFFFFYKNTNLVGDLNMFNVHNLIEISHHNDQYCLFYHKNDSSFTHFLDLTNGVQVKGSYL